MHSAVRTIGVFEAVEVTSTPTRLQDAGGEHGRHPPQYIPNRTDKKQGAKKMTIP